MAEQHFDGTHLGEQGDVAGMSALDIADWRLRTFALYATTRKIAADSPAEAHSYWRQERDRMFGTHPASALTAEAKASFDGLKTADYDPIYRFHVPITPEGAGREMTVETGTDGLVRFVRLGTFDLPEMGQLAVWKLKGYGGGIFVPFRDATAGQPGGSYGAGRYLLDTIKGAFHGVQRLRSQGRIRPGLQFRLQPLLRVQRSLGMSPCRSGQPAGRGHPRGRAVLSGWSPSSNSRPLPPPSSADRTPGATAESSATPWSGSSSGSPASALSAR